MRRTSFLAPVAAVAIVATSVWAMGAGCTWPDFVADHGTAIDTGVVETFTDVPAGDSKETGPGNVDAFPLPDGRICKGHDEDDDGVPDECDNCPNVSNASQGSGDIGSACAPGAAFATSAKRILFDPFKSFSFSIWKPSPQSSPYDAGFAGVSDKEGFFTEGADNDSFLGGTVSDTEATFDGSSAPPVLHFAQASTGAGPSAAIVTTLLSIQQEVSGNAGVLLRITGDPQRFYVCAVSTGGFFAAAHVLDTGCTGGPCAPVAFAFADGGSTNAPMPKAVPHAMGDMIGVRASVTPGGGATTSGVFECRVFDPSTPATLQSSDPTFAIKVDVPSSRWVPAGEVGLYAQRAKAQFFSIDVLAGP